MPEGDTIHRSAATLQRWIGGREITRAESRVRKVRAEAMVGTTVDQVEARGKHLMVRFSSGHVLHSHMRMTGSWHVYTVGDRWRKPGWQARVVIEAGDRQAVCFDAPVVELLRPGFEAHVGSLAGLGPDVLVPPVDHAEVVRRARLLPADQPIGVVLLDQRVAAGIGNIWRCESLFVRQVDPWETRGAVGDAGLVALVETASALMGRNLEPAQGFGRDSGAGAKRNWVYGRTGRPCRRCGSRIESRPMGDQPRICYWCPSCQTPSSSS